VNESVQVVALVSHARHVPAEEREAFAARIRAAAPGPGLVLETCHRVEAYWTTVEDPHELADRSGLPDGGQLLPGDAAARHAIAVAVGRDSVVIGEDQVLHQLRESVDGARRAARLDPALERLFSLALQAGRRARSWHQGPSRSLADVAVAAIEGRTGPLAGRAVLVVGAGRMGRLAVGAANDAGASVVIANRSAERGVALARASGASIGAFDPGAGVTTFAAVIVALGGPWAISSATSASLVDSDAIVVDLSVPQALDPACSTQLAGRFVSADALALADAEPAGSNTAPLHRLDRLVDQTTDAFSAWLAGRASRATAEALLEQVDRERMAELELLWRHRPDLKPEDRDAIEGMTRHLARRWLRTPLERLGRDSDGRDERAVRDLFAL